MEKSIVNSFSSESFNNCSDIQFIWKDRLPYRESLTLQEKLKESASKNRQAFLLGFECPACITLGLRGTKEKDLSANIEEYKKKQIEIVPIKRGGQATLHSPGQLVIYPIMELLKWKIRLRDFLSMLEKITIITLKEYGIFAVKKETSAGLWTNKGKIAFFGIHISGGVSQHGLAINIQNDLKLFQLIRSCGVLNRPHDSFKNQGVSANLKEVFSFWCKTAKSFFHSHLNK